MKLSTAIRKNGYKKAKNVLFRFSKNGKIISACALGQAYLNTFPERTIYKNTNYHIAIVDLQNKYEVLRFIQKCPIKKCPSILPTTLLIEHLNDHHNLSLNKISNLVKAIEDIYETI